MPSGELKRRNDEKGFGFIGPDDGGEDLFCHVSGLLDGEGSVREGDRVRFKITFDERKGKDRAVDVEVSGGGGGGGGGRDSGRDRDYGGGRDRDSGKGSGKGSKPGDWDCLDCGAMNFASRTECFKCGARKPRDGGRGGGGRDRDDR